MKSFFERINIDMKYYSLHIKSSVKCKTDWEILKIGFNVNYYIRQEPYIVENIEKLNEYLVLHDCKAYKIENNKTICDKLFVKRFSSKKRLYKLILYIEDKL